MLPPMIGVGWARVLLVLALLANVAHAQDDEPIEEIITVGVRMSILDSVATKRNSDDFVVDCRQILVQIVCERLPYLIRHVMFFQQYSGINAKSNGS